VLTRKFLMPSLVSWLEAKSRNDGGLLFKPCSTTFPRVWWEYPGFPQLPVAAAELAACLE